MQVDIHDGILSLIPDTDLKSSQKSQLSYWEFYKNNNSYERNIIEDDSLLIKVINFFDKERIQLELTNNCKDYLKKIESAKEEFQTIFDNSKSYKDGDSQSVKKFSSVTTAIQSVATRKLKAHQLKAATHLYLSQNGANFSVPGSGKTSVTLSVYEKRRQEGKVNTLFVIGPPSCFQPWRDEFRETLGREPIYQLLAGGNSEDRKSSYFVSASKKPELYLTSFQTLLRDHKEVETFMRRLGIDVFLVIDEAHYMKKLEGNWAKSILGLSKYAKFRCALTGTPMPKSYSDLYNLFDFLWSEHDPLTSSTKIKIQQYEKNKEYQQIKDILKIKIGPLFYRVRKKDLQLKPATFHDPTKIQMNKYEKLIYDLIENRIVEFSKEDYLKNTEVVKRLRRGRIIRLRQCVSYPHLLLNAVEGYDEDVLGGETDLVRIINKYNDFEKPAKLEYLLRTLRETNSQGEKVIVWSNFVSTIELIQKLLKDNNINSKSIYGKTPIEQQSINEEETREKIRKVFLDTKSGINVLIANPAACAESISLHTTCHKAIYYDLSYNCSQYLQSLDRIHRVGGSENVDTHYYFLQYDNTIDEDISKNLKEKADRMNSLIEEDYSIYNLDMFEGDDDEQAYIHLFGEEK